MKGFETFFQNNRDQGKDPPRSQGTFHRRTQWNKFWRSAVQWVVTAGPPVVTGWRSTVDGWYFFDWKLNSKLIWTSKRTLTDWFAWRELDWNWIKYHLLGPLPCPGTQRDPTQRPTCYMPNAWLIAVSAGRRRCNLGQKDRFWVNEQQEGKNEFGFMDFERLKQGLAVLRPGRMSQCRNHGAGHVSWSDV